MASESPARTDTAIAAAEAALRSARRETHEAPVEKKKRNPSSVRHEHEIAWQGKRINFERRVLLMALMAGVPGTVISVALLWWGDYSAKVQWTLLMFIVCWWLGFVFALQRRVVQPLQTLSNLLAALHEGDYSIRARGATRGDALGDVLAEVNDFGVLLREQRLGAMEATALLRTVMREIDVAIFAFDAEERLRLINAAGESLLARPAERILNSTAEELGLREALRCDENCTMQMSFRGKAARWGVRRTVFREHGVPHQLLVLTDLSRTLREEERLAWQRLVRVLGHELNNSLAPIKSIAGSLQSLIRREHRPEDWQEDAERGLSVIASRAAALGRFTASYTRLAKLPEPRLQKVSAKSLIERIVNLETRLDVEILQSIDVMIDADPDQLEQLLINLIRNGVDAALETSGRVAVSWQKTGAELEIRVEDEGHGLPPAANLFVPFFTTKQNGSGIGLVLSRQIAEAHNGTLTLGNRVDRAGCVARLRLPL